MAVGTLAPNVIASGHDQGVILLDRASGRLFAANRTGARIWEGLERRLTLESIAQSLSVAHHISLDAARAHTTTFIATLAHHQLLK